MNPPQKNPSFLSLPDEIILNCLAHISRSYYPKLSLVCKTFRSFIVSDELKVARYHLKTHETLFYVCLQLPNDPCPTWFTLWIKPGQILTNQLEKKTTTTQNTRLVVIPSSYYSHPPWFVVSFGSETYALSQYNLPSSIMFVTKEIFLWRNAPNMTVPRTKASAVVFNGKIYVMGGCAADESANWGEVFDPKTQTWEPLPDPGAELRFTSIRKIEEIKGKLYIRSNENKDSVYDPKVNKWDVTEKAPMQCIVGNVLYYCDSRSCFWYDAKRNEWRVVRGLDMFNNNHRCGMIEIAEYGGKLLILWDKFVLPGWQHKDIWCAVIAFERLEGNDEVWGNVEWANIVLTVPSSYVFLHSLLNMV